MSNIPRFDCINEEEEFLKNPIVQTDRDDIYNDDSLDQQVDLQSIKNRPKPQDVHSRIYKNQQNKL